MTEMNDTRISLALLPGLLSDAWVWQPQMESLADIADCRVSDLQNVSDIQDMARAVLEEMPPRFALAGWSMGGYVAMAIMQIAPERVSHLALLATQPCPDTPEQARRRADIVARTQAGDFTNVIRDMRALAYHAPHQTDQALMAAHRAMSERVGQTVFLRQQAAITARADQRATLAAVRCPTLILCGRHDRTTPLTESEAMARIMPHARLVVCEDAAHMLTREAPIPVNAALRQWLASSGSSSTP